MRVASFVTLAAGVFCVGILAAGERAPSKTTSPLARAPAGPGGARNLSLAPGLSFTDDSSGAFPIRGDNLADGSIASDRPTAIFFGTSHCYNTNREAERFVALFQKRRDDARFLVVDVHEPSSAQRPLVARFFAGYIPTLAFLDSRGNTVYHRSGETARTRGDISVLEEILERARLMR